MNTIMKYINQIMDDSCNTISQFKNLLIRVIAEQMAINNRLSYLVFSEGNAFTPFNIDKLSEMGLTELVVEMARQMKATNTFISEIESKAGGEG